MEREKAGERNTFGRGGRTRAFAEGETPATGYVRVGSFSGHRVSAASTISKSASSKCGQNLFFSLPVATELGSAAIISQQDS